MAKKILIIPDSFKDSISSSQFCDIAKNVLTKINPNIIVHTIPIGDGGEGSLNSFRIMKDYTFKTLTVKDPLNKNIKAKYCINKLEKIGIIELAQASGIQLVPENLRNPLNTTSYGVGQLIDKAISEGMKKIIMFIGGSATNDAGIGMLDALGYTFKDKNYNKLIANVKNLKKIEKIEKSSFHNTIKKIEFTVACDVSNPLFGKNGATYVFGEQKGATDKILKFLEESIIHFSKVVAKNISKNYSKHNGAGAAGGVGFTALSFFNAKFVEGFSLLSQILKIEKKIELEKYDYIITGEGCIDKQTKHGKLLKKLGYLGQCYSIPVIAFAGNIKGELSSLNLPGISNAYQITPHNTELKLAIKNTSTNLSKSLNEQMNKLLN
jgi:glycerate kinase